MSASTSMQPAPLQELQGRAPAKSRPQTGGQAELSAEEFVLIAGGHNAFQLLWAGAELDLFSLLSGGEGLTRQQIALALGLEAQPARILLHGLTALRLLKKEDGLYRNSAMAEERLVRGRPGCWIPLLGWQHHIVYPGLLDFVESLKGNRNAGLRHFAGSGETLYERLRENPGVEQVFQNAMSSLSGKANRELAERIPLQQTRHLVDVGGGDGSNALCLAGRFDHLRVTVYDSETVTALAREKIAAAGMQGRVDAMVGDCFHDPFPAGADGILLAHIATIWSAERNTRLFRRCFEHLPAGGRLFIFNMVSYDDETGPLITALGSPYFQAIATGEGMLYCEKDIRSWLQAAGFGIHSSLSLPLEHRLITAVKP